MRRISGTLAGGAVLSLLLLACSPDKPAGPRSLRLDASEAPAASLVEHVVAPQATDPAIDRFLDTHYAWLDTTARSNQKLLVFMPGARQAPAMFQRVQQEAARLGYHVIGLMYSDNPQGFTIGCSVDPDPATCYENGRLEMLDGIDRSPFMAVNEANSIYNRLTKLLQFLAAQYPNEEWSRFLLHDAPKWSQIAVSGHSLGGGEVAIIAKPHVVDRVVLFSSVTDSVHGEAPAWEVGHKTPTERYWGIAHDRDGFFPGIRAGWDSLGMAVFGPAVAPETNEPPYGFTHMLVTDLTPVGGFVGTNAHGAPSNDLNTPLGPDGTPLLRDAWRYLLTARGAGREDAEDTEISSGGGR